MSNRLLETRTFDRRLHGVLVRIFLVVVRWESVVVLLGLPFVIVVLNLIRVSVGKHLEARKIFTSGSARALPAAFALSTGVASSSESITKRGIWPVPLRDVVAKKKGRLMNLTKLS